MRICISGTDSIGKTSLIDAFLKEYPMYKAPPPADKTIKHSSKLSLLKSMREYVSDQAMNYTSNANVVYDGGILDIAVDAIVCNDREPEDVTESFVHTTLHLSREVNKFYDIVFILPISEMNPVYDIDPDIAALRAEKDQIYKAAHVTFINAKDMFFDMKDTPAVIELVGDIQSRLAMIKLYVDPSTGSVPDKSLL